MNRILNLISDEIAVEQPQAAGSTAEAADDSELLDAYSRAVTRVVRAVSPSVTHDRVLSGDFARVAELIARGELAVVLR